MINFQNAHHTLFKMFFQAQKLCRTSANLFLGQRTEQHDIKSVAKYFVLDSASVKFLREISLKCYLCFHASLSPLTHGNWGTCLCCPGFEDLADKAFSDMAGCVCFPHADTHILCALKTHQNHHKEVKEFCKLSSFIELEKQVYLECNEVRKEQEKNYQHILNISPK